MENVIDELARMNLTISSCESITGGWFAKTVSDIPGASRTFKGSIVAYTDDIKLNVVKIKQEILKNYGAVSSECAVAMATNIKLLFKADIGISFTGNAGPTNLEQKPLGLVYIALSFQDTCLVKQFNFSGSRDEIRRLSLAAGLKLLKDNLIKIKKGITEVNV